MIDTLKTLLAPGRRVRLSPYVQDAQFLVLFGETPNPSDRINSMKDIMTRHDAEIQKIADKYIRFAKNKTSKFTPEEYLTEEFLRMYLSYYFTTNVPKIQLNLLSLFEKRLLSEELDIIDIGVGSGTTTIAVLDFLLTWANVCHLHGKAFPVKKVSIRCKDISVVCLKMGREVTEAYCDSINRRMSMLSSDSSISDIMSKIINWGKETDWIQYDLNEAPIEFTGNTQTLLFASNVLFELSDKGKKNLINSISNMPNRSVATVIEPGDQKKCQGLNKWKIDLLRSSKDVKPLLPCDLSDLNNNSPCKICWNARRESIHEPLLYKLLRDRIGDERRTDEYINNLLSWSYVSFIKSKTSEMISYVSDPTVFNAIYLSTFLKRDAEGWEIMESGFDEKKEERNEGKKYQEILHFCSNSKPLGRNKIFAERLPGYTIEPYEHGDRIKIRLEKYKLNEDRLDLILGNNTLVYDDANIRKSNEFLSSYVKATAEAIDEVAYRLFGFTAMRPFQHDILKRVLTGKSTLGIAATGGGKSECYILPSMLFTGITIVLSPLKALMQDQFDKRIDQRYGLKNIATFINGDVPFKKRQAILKRLELGYYKLAYFTPEQLRETYILNSLKRADEKVGIRYLALDEAHCISQWGHDFRDSYLNIVERFKTLGINPISIALTATASPEVRADLCEELLLNNSPIEEGGDVYVHSSNRAELNFVVKPVKTTEEKVKDIVDRLKRFLDDNKGNPKPGAAIIFMPTKGANSENTYYYFPEDGKSFNKGKLSAGVTNFASFLERTLQTKVSIYHSDLEYDNENNKTNEFKNRKLGDLTGRNRRTEQNDFIEGHTSIMVATKGFGMGVDKANVRLIIHRTPTANLEAYAQEAGRAGRNGDIADVILYYSPDRVQDESDSMERSDYSIQEYFLLEKYIRKEDVLAMRNFLLSVDRKVNNHLYFTSDEAIPYFDQLEAESSFSWPEFSTRIVNSYESPEHQEVLDRGHVYTSKTKYIGRILSVLYRIRPDLGEQEKASLIESEKKTNAVLLFDHHSHAISYENIIQSNEYFGEILRKKDISANQLRNWLDQCKSDSTIAFAEHLNITVSQLERMLLDIKFADGYFRNSYGKARWKSNLLHFSYMRAPLFGAAKGKITVAAWRDYAGAERRSSKAYQNAENASKNGEIREKNKKGYKPIIDDWFGAKELTKPVGWEVQPGAALLDHQLFEDYLETFMKVHDRRRENDKAAYKLLLTDYIGVNENGMLQTSSKEGNCLRAVLLGYLKTGEVVQDNCLSCSRCVPTGKYENDMEKRKHVVEKLGVEILKMLEHLESGRNEIPKLAVLENIWEQIKVSEAKGQSLLAYIEGWSGRIISDTPNHKTALYIRLDGMVKGYWPIQSEEIYFRVKELTDNASPDEFVRIKELLSSLCELLPNEAELIIEKADLCINMEQYQEAQDALKAAINKSDSLKIDYKAHLKLVNLSKESGRLPDQEMFLKHSLYAARKAPKYKDIEEIYDTISADWSWDRILDEIIFHLEEKRDNENSQKLLLWWFERYTKYKQLGGLSKDRNDWTQHIKDIFSCLEHKTIDKYKLDDFIARDLYDWCNRELNKDSICKKSMFALLIVLIANKNFKIKSNIVKLSLQLAADFNDGEVEWLIGIIDNSKNDECKYLKTVILGEICYYKGDYYSASQYWQSTIDDYKKYLLLESLLVLLRRLVAIHKPDGPLPNLKLIFSVILDRAKKSEQWLTAKKLYDLILPYFDENALKSELISLCALDRITWLDKLIMAWMEMKGMSKGRAVPVSLFNQLPSSASNNSGLANLLIDNGYPLADVVKTYAGKEKVNTLVKVLNKEFTAANKLAQRGNYNQIMLNKNSIDLYKQDFEILAAAHLTGVIDTEEIIAAGLPSIYFNYFNEEFTSYSSTEIKALMYELIIDGEMNAFFLYKPATDKEINRWLMLFAPLLNIEGKHIDIITNVIDNIVNSVYKSDSPKNFRKSTQFIESHIDRRRKKESQNNFYNSRPYYYSPKYSNELKEWLFWMLPLVKRNNDDAKGLNMILMKILDCSSLEALMESLDLFKRSGIEEAVIREVITNDESIPEIKLKSIKELEQLLIIYNTSFEGKGKKYIDNITNIASGFFDGLTYKDWGLFIEYWDLLKKYEINQFLPDNKIINEFCEVAELIEKETAIPSARKLESFHLTELKNVAYKRKSEYRSDIYIAILHGIYRKSPPTWLTPLSHYIEALINTGRIDEVFVIRDWLQGGQVDKLTIGKQRIFLEEGIKRYNGPQRSEPSYAYLLERLVAMYIVTWHN